MKRTSTPERETGGSGGTLTRRLDARARSLLRSPPLVAASALACLGVLAGVAWLWDGPDGAVTAEAPASESPSRSSAAGADGRGDEDGRRDRELPGETIEAGVGEPLAIADLVVTVNEARLEDDPGGWEQVVVPVTLENASAVPRRYGYAAFSLTTEGGLILFPLSPIREDSLGLGTLEAGEKTSGTVAFDAGPGAHTLVFDPGVDPTHPLRATWVLKL